MEKSGKFAGMKPLIGEYACKLDDKGRFLLPSALRKQLPDDQQTQFVVNRGLDKCLSLYPVAVWEQETARIQSLNPYVAENRAFVRMFLNGASPVNVDSSDRINLPKALMDFAGLSKEILLIAQLNKIEIWDKETYEQWLANPEFDFASLAEKVMK